ncbi:MAG: peptide ABC transporter substrate-binding protein [Treponema sp.]|nr:peptide ABC transporter substrate-binding protein [Treponema sp.]
MRKIVFLLLCAVLLTGTVFASGGGQQSAASSASTEMVIGNGANPQSLDPTQITGVPEHRIYMALFEGLVTEDPHTCKATPGAAESWVYSNNNTVITFTIRQGLTWSDGTPITAQTFVDSWLYHLNPTTASNYAYMIGMVVKGAEEYNTGTGKASDVGIRAIDDRHFEVTLVGPVPYALDMMSHYAFSPIPMQAVQKYGNNWTRPENWVGNGPFVLQEYTPNSRVVVVPNARYWNKANVFLTKITFLPIDDANTAYQGYLNGEIDWSTGIPLPQIDQIKLRPDYQVAPQLGTYYYLMNNRDVPVLRDVRVRQALSMSFDRQELIDKVVKGGQLPALGLSPPMGDYQPAVGQGYNVAAAQKLLADAGYPGGQGFPTLEVVYNTLDAHKIIGEYLQAAWKTNLGINVNLVNMEWATYLDYRKTPNMQIARAGWIADYQDPQNFLDLLYSTSGNNDGNYNNPQYDALIKQASAMPDGPDRNKILFQAETIAITQDQAMIPIYWYVSQNMIDLTKWDGWYTNPQDVHPYVGIKHK